MNSQMTSGASLTPNIFRGAVAASLVLGVVPLDLLFPTLVAPAIAQAAEGEPLPALYDHWWFWAMTSVMLVVTLAATAGLILFKRWARPLALLATLGALALQPTLGTLVNSGVSTALTDAASMLWGAALAAAYFAPLRQRFGDSA